MTLPSSRDRHAPRTRTTDSLTFDQFENQLMTLSLLTASERILTLSVLFASVNMSTCQHVKMSTCQHVNMSTCQHVNMSTCQHVIMSTCQHVNKLSMGQTPIAI